MIAVDRTQLTPAYRMGRGLAAATLLAGVVMTLAGAYMTYMSWVH